jgi:prepilin-type processing-associated H-X9-DG protein/prepilin-type N-terminal cleavage/methylation domain-containing protein
MRGNQSITHRRRAFTVLELLVVIAIIGVLIGLLFPALMAARESARRLQCTSNLHEIGLAVQQHHDATRRLPEAWTKASDGISGYGWAVALLPYLEESDLRKTVNCKLAVSAAQNDRPRNTDLSIMRCPSDISDPVFELYAEHHNVATGHSTSAVLIGGVDETAPLVRLPAANYVGVFGTLEADETFPAPAGDGPIVSGRAVRYADLERGQSHTLTIGERTTAMVPSTWLGVNFRGEDAACRLVGSAITTPSCDNCDECEFGSRHSGGSNFVWADGHVSLVLRDIDPLEYQRLAKRRTQ